MRSSGQERLRPGCPLSTILFLIYIAGSIPKEMAGRRDKNGGNKRRSLMYADDIVLIADNRDERHVENEIFRN